MHKLLGCKKCLCVAKQRCQMTRCGCGCAFKLNSHLWWAKSLKIIASKKKKKKQQFWWPDEQKYQKWDDPMCSNGIFCHFYHSKCYFWWWCFTKRPSYLFDLVFGLLQFVWFVGELQFGFSFPFLLQQHLTVLPLLPRLHTVIKHTLSKHTHLL